MITNAAPRPWVPGMPVKLYGHSTDEKPAEWGGKPIANGSKFHEVNTDTTYIFDQEHAGWREWTENRGGDSGGSGMPASNSDVDDALDELFPTAGGIDGDDTPSGNTATDSDVDDALDDIFGP